MLDFLKDNKDAIDILIKIGTLLFVALGFFWTIRSGIKTLLDNRKNKDEEQKVKWITFFNEEGQAKKLAGVYGLVKYTHDLYNEIFCLCVTEKNIFIKALLYENLLKESSSLINEFISINRFYTKILAGYYSINAEYSISNSLSKSHLSFIYDEHIKIKNQNESLRNFRFFMDNNCSFEHMIDYIILSSHMIMHGFKKNSAYTIERLFFLSTDFLSNEFKELTFKSCLFVDNSVAHTRFINVKVSNCYVSMNNNFFGSTFENTIFHKTNMDKSIFRKCSLNHVILSESKFITDCDFSSSDIHNCKIVNSILSFIGFKGCNISNTVFEALTMKKNCDFRGAIFEKNCKFDTINIWKSNLSNCEFTDCSFAMIKFGGSDLSNTKFINVSFQNVDFSGVNMRNTFFLNCKFIQNPMPKNIKNIDTVKEMNCNGSVFIDKNNQ